MHCRYADVDACPGLLSVDDTQSNMDKVQHLFSVNGRQQTPLDDAETKCAEVET